MKNRFYSFGYFLVAGAAADVGLQPLMHGLITGVGMDINQALAVHNKTGCAISALEGEFLHKSLLYGDIIQAFDGSYFMADRLDCQHQARFDWPPVYQNRAGSAIPIFTAGFGTGQAQALPQGKKQRISRSHQCLPELSIDIDLNYSFNKKMKHF